MKEICFIQDFKFQIIFPLICILPYLPCKKSGTGGGTGWCRKCSKWHGSCGTYRNVSRNGTDITERVARNITSYEMAHSDGTYVYVTHVLDRDTSWLVSWRANLKKERYLMISL